MKHIAKVEFQDFKEFVQKNKPQTWDDLDSEVRTNTRRYILEQEQLNQCAYTELPLEYEKDDSHIEHLKRKHQGFFPELTFEWSNLFVSCNSSDFGGQYKDHVYLKDKTKNDNAQILNPSLENPENYFEYYTWGEIKIKAGIDNSQKEKVQKTIDAFNLKFKSLNERRRSILNSIQAYKMGGLNANQIRAYLDKSGFNSVIENELK